LANFTAILDKLRSHMSDITLILSAIDQGDARAAAQLMPVVYEEMRRLARHHMAQERAGHTLQATALVHEAYLRLVGPGCQPCRSRSQFFAAAAEAMRRILIEHARRKMSLRRGGGSERIPLNDELAALVAQNACAPEELLDLDAALDELARRDPVQAQLVKLLFFAGMNLDDAAHTLGLSRTTAHRYWLFARAWLRYAVWDHSQPPGGGEGRFAPPGPEDREKPAMSPPDGIF
jgi:RNA polymerase sigma factor (TIGR02999 family)